MVDVETIKKGARNPGKALKHVSSRAYTASKISLFSRYPVGTPVWDKDWDVLVILDSCRVDALRAIQSEYPFLNDVGSIVSVGSHSAEWMSQTFTKEWENELQDTAYISANPFSKTVIENHLEVTEGQVDQSVGAVEQLRRWGSWDIADHRDVGHLEHVWHHVLEGSENSFLHGKDIDPDTVPEYITPPKYVTDRGIDVWRQSDVDRMILHYWQPHTPYIANALKEERSLEEFERSFKEYLQNSGSKRTLFNSYLDELRYVLDSVKILLENLDADTVAISADHGEAMGEYRQYKHPITCLNPHVKKVPWTTTTATDNQTYEPELKSPTSKSHSPEELLKSLGYK